MARLFHESFDRLTPAELQSLGKWAFVGSGIVSTTGKTANGVTGTSGATQAQNTLRTLAMFPATPNEGYHGFALKCVSLPAAERKVWTLFDSAGTALVTSTIRTDGKVRTYRGTFESGTLLGTSATAFTATAFRYLQAGYNATSDSLLVLSTASGVTSLLATSPGLTSPLPWSYAEFYLDHLLVLDDYYVNDGTSLGGVGNAYFSGETSIVVVGPATEAHTGFGLEAWVPNTGSDKVAVIDDTALDYDATYLRARDAYQYALFGMDALTDDGRTVDDVQAVIVSRAVSSDWAPEFGVYMRRSDGTALFSGRVPLTWTGYRAQARMLRGTGAFGGVSLTVTRVNNSVFGFAD